MPATMELHEKNRILHPTYTASLLLQEIFDLYPADKAFCDQFAYKIHLIVDVRNIGAPPHGVLNTHFSPSHIPKDKLAETSLGG